VEGEVEAVVEGEAEAAVVEGEAEAAVVEGEAEAAVVEGEAEAAPPPPQGELPPPPTLGELLVEHIRREGLPVNSEGLITLLEWRDCISELGLKAEQHETDVLICHSRCHSRGSNPRLAEVPGQVCCSRVEACAWAGDIRRHRSRW
jgi:hypothetical protein